MGEVLRCCKTNARCGSGDEDCFSFKSFWRWSGEGDEREFEESQEADKRRHLWVIEQSD